MKSHIFSVLALATAIGALIWHKMDRPPKIAYVETAVIMSQFSEAIKAKHQFEESQKEWDANLKRLNDSLMATMSRMKTEYDKAPVPDKKKMRDELDKRNDDYQRYTGAVKKMSQDKEQELMEPVIKKINGFLDIWGSQHGYDLIFGTMSGGNILQAKAAFNATSKVLYDMNEQYKDLPVEKMDASKVKR
jgi:outer membrane protein